MKNTIISILLLSLFSLGYLLTDNKINEKKLHIVIVNKEKDSKDLAKKIVTKDIKSDLNIFKKEKEALTKSSQMISPFNEVDIDDVKLTMQTIVGVEPISAIHIDKNMLKTVQTGDTLVLPEIDGVSYELEVTHRTISENDNISLNGVLSENGIEYHAVITEGTKLTLMSFSTPTASYEVELLDGTGYIYLNADIENEKINYAKSDVIENIS